MPKKSFVRFVGTSVLFAGILVLPVSAYAGFQWVAPDTSASQLPSVGVYPLPPRVSSAASAPEVISPVIITGDSDPVAKTIPLSVSSSAPTPPPPIPVAVPSAQISSAPPAVIPLPPSQAPMPAPQRAQNDRADLATATITMPPASGGDIVQGFASDVPLALALRQVLPVGYSFSIDQNIDMDTDVSYKGGKSWRETVREMIAPAGLVSREQGTTLIVSRVPVAASAPMAIAPSVPAPSSTQVLSVSGAVPAPTPQSLGRMDMPAPAPQMIAARSDIPALSVSSADGWSADHGDTLHRVLTKWCARAGVELQWLAEYDYPVEASVHFSGGFEDAVRNFLIGFETARPQPIGELHSNSSAGQMVLVISPRGNSYSN